MPPWKKRQRKKGREAKKTGKICGFDARISPWGTAGWLAPLSAGDPEHSRNVCNAPQDACFQQSLANRPEQTGRKEGRERKGSGSGEVTGREGKSGWSWRKWYRVNVCVWWWGGKGFKEEGEQ